MLYFLFEYLDKTFNLPGAGLFQFISFRASMGVITSLVITLIFGKRFIFYLKNKQIKEEVRDLGLIGQKEKEGTPTMGGLIILAAIVIPTILFANLKNIYILLILFSTISLGLIGFADDYIKIFKNNKKGLSGKFKIVGQVFVGLVVGYVLYFSPQVVIREKTPNSKVVKVIADTSFVKTNNFSSTPTKSTKTTIPFFKNNEFDYSILIKGLCKDYKKYAWIIFIPFVIFIITAVSNGANITDGIDGLAAGSSAIIGATLGLFAWLSGHIFFADYLNIMYIPDIGELAIFIMAFVGACTGFLWYNTYPAQVFMGDTGSLSLGGIIAIIAIMIRKELLLPILCGIFVIENLSVLLQRYYFKYTKHKFGEGRRIFKMSPIHHHFQKIGYSEPKIVARFHIIGIMLAIITILTFKIR